LLRKTGLKRWSRKYPLHVIGNRFG
jgi:hypothetical protein